MFNNKQTKQVTLDFQTNISQYFFQLCPKKKKRTANISLMALVLCFDMITWTFFPSLDKASGPNAGFVSMCEGSDSTESNSIISAMISEQKDAFKASNENVTSYTESTGT